jgi:hypothetical protein
VSVCKSRTHKRYSDAIEGLFIQTWIALQDLAGQVKLAQEDELAGEQKGMYLVLHQHKIDDVIERLRFGKDELRTAEIEVDRHIARGCKALNEVWRPIEPTHEHRVGA